MGTYFLFFANLVEQIQKRLGILLRGRKILEEEDDFQSRDGQSGYGDRGQFNGDNSFYWDLDNKPAYPHIP